MPAYFGLDIGSTSIKLIHTDGDRVKFLGFGKNQFGKDVIAMTNSEMIALTDSLRVLIRESGLKTNKVVTSVPESTVFSRVLKFPIMSSPELATAIKWELDQSVPFPPSEAETSWVVLQKPDKYDSEAKILVYVVAVPSRISETYIQMMDLVGLEAVRVENEIPALSRVFAGNLSDSSPAIIADWGASGTNLVISGKTKLFGNFYVPVGGSAMTKMIAETFGLPLDQAESYKRSYGFAKDQLDGKMFTILKPVVDNVIGEIRKLMISFKDDHAGSVVEKFILTGGGSYLLGLIPYLSESLNLEVVMGDSFSGLEVDTKYKNLGPVFAVAKGLAM